jgi:hypothetical protein
MTELLGPNGGSAAGRPTAGVPQADDFHLEVHA